jgi:hypothetical protein
MPANDCLRLHENQRLPPPRPESSQDHPEQLVRSSKPDLRAAFQCLKLLPKSKILQEQIAANMKRSVSQNKKEPQQAEHEASLTRKSRRNRMHSYLPDLSVDRYFGQAQLLIDILKAGS